MKKYIRNPRKMEESNAGSPIQEQGKEESNEEEVRVQQEGNGSGKEVSEGNRGQDKDE